MADLVRLEGVVRDFGEHVVTRVLHGIDLQVQAGEFAALIGPSGSGKSTLLNLIGLLDRPTAGRVSIAGVDTGGHSDEERTAFRGRSLGFVFQFHHLLPAFTARENVMMPLLATRGRADDEARERADRLLAEFGLAGRENALAVDLSGGQQQRVAIARALVASPPLVLADEPTGNLDTATGEQVFRLLREVNERRGTGFLIVTHDPRLAATCDRRVTLADGQIVADER